MICYWRRHRIRVSLEFILSPHTPSEFYKVPQSVLVLESSKEVKPARIRWIWPDCEQALWVAGHVIQPSNYQRERSTNRTTAGHGRSDGRLQTQPPLSIFSTAHGLSHIWRLNMLRFSRLHYVQYSSNRQ